jgi:hypothetical protein
LLWLILLAPLTLGLGSCGLFSSEDDPPEMEEEPTPNIEMSSIEGTCSDGDPCLQFFAKADMDLFYKKATIEPPPPFDPITYNLGNSFVISEESIALQEEDRAYTKTSGTWTFIFDVTAGSGANALDHTIRVDLRISGKRSIAPKSTSLVAKTR